jgi:S-adenosylmethionine-diacylglycerol 3-amino-3-carboxypropyl transferase
VSGWLLSASFGADHRKAPHEYLCRCSPRASAKLLAKRFIAAAHFSLAGCMSAPLRFAFRGLVYPQIWEDPRVDLEALQLSPPSRVVTIASGGCNVMSYLAGDPEQIVAVDLNATHVALNKLKLAALRHLPDTRHSCASSARPTRRPMSTLTTDTCAAISTTPPSPTGKAPTCFGRRRVTRFAAGFHRFGLLGRFIWRRTPARPPVRQRPRRRCCRAQSRGAAAISSAPNWRRCSTSGSCADCWATACPSTASASRRPNTSSLSDGAATAADVVRARLEKLACDFDLADNYFAWQAFNAPTRRPVQGPLPPYLQADTFRGDPRSRAPRARRADLADRIPDAQPAASLDRYVLLDAQDWMSDQDLTRLWQQITRTARPAPA